MSMLNLQQLASIPNANSTAHVLLISTPNDTILTPDKILHHDDFHITKASTVQDVLMLITQFKFSLIIIDNHSSKLDPSFLINTIRKSNHHHQVPIILIIDGQSTPSKLATNYNMERVHHLFTPINYESLHSYITNVINRTCVSGLDSLPHPNLGFSTLNNYYPERTTQILECISEAYMAIDRNWRIIYCNQAAINFLDPIAYNQARTNLAENLLWELLDVNIKSQIYDPLQEAMQSFKPVNVIVYDCDNWFKIRAYPIDDGLSLYCVDITEKKKLEEEIVRLERLKLIAQMAAGITHEVRNPISVVRAVLDLARLADKPISQEKINMMIQEIDRANSIISEFLSLTNTNNYKKELISLDKLVTQLVPLIEAKVYNCNKRLMLDLQKCNPIYLCPQKIDQLILNLVFNGLEAMKHQGETLTIRTYQKFNDVYLEVSDEGTGIEMKDLQNIWDPFFTTKEDGTGLGLAICNTIVKNHNGIIDVETNNQGTTFIVRFKQYTSKGN